MADSPTISPNAEASSSRHVESIKPRALRVSQIDADELDEGLVSMLSENVERSLGNFRSVFQLDLKPEIALVLKLVIFRYGIFGPSQASPGARLQNLKLTSEGLDGRISRQKLLLYLLLHPPIFPTYLMTRFRNRALSQQWPDLPPHDFRRKLWTAMVRLENLAKAWELAGWGWFLWDGKYPSLLMRILKIRLIPSSSRLARMVSYEFMNRQLVWGMFTEFMMFAFPLLPTLPSYLAPSRLFAPIRNLLSPPETIDYSELLSHSIPLSSLNGITTKVSSSRQHTGPYANLPKTTCPICHLRLVSQPTPLDSHTSSGAAISLPPIPKDSVEEDEEQKEETRIYVPAQTDCWGGCRWCYYCIAGELAGSLTESKENRDGKEGKGEKNDSEAVIKWNCLRCGGDVSRAWRVGAEGDREPIIEPKVVDPI